MIFTNFVTGIKPDFCWIALLFFSHLGSSQNQEILFPDLEGGALLEAVQQQYTPAFVQTFGTARDSLFGRVYQVNDSLRCVYTGYTIYLDPSQDPTSFAFMNGSGINTEHTYPRAKGADRDPARADMHHLYPTRVDVNAARANFPFAEIPDHLTQKWYYKNQFRSSIPPTNIDAYSEFRDGAFEPPEHHKGNVARAMFYFYTIYRAEAHAADPSFFAAQVETLCNWHYQDPVDEAEWNRTWLIAHYQNDKPNPFVLDCTLASRLYCENSEANCLLDLFDLDEANKDIQIKKPYPNPFQQQVIIPIELAQPANIEVRLYNGMGQISHQFVNQNVLAGTHQIPLRFAESPQFTTGLCWARVRVEQNGVIYQKWLKLLYLP